MVTLSFDVGSSNCSIGYYDSSLPTMVSSGYNSHDIQSNIFLLNDKRIVGESIEKEVFANNIGNCISLFKHLLSRDINDSEVTKMKKFIPCEIIEEADNKIGFIIKYKNETIILSCEQILATMYNHLFKCSPLQLPRNVILTCPAFFTSSQRQAMLDASMIAEFKCEKILNESTAILSYYSLTNRDNDEVYSTILFINIGCTSGEVNLFSIKKEVCILLGSKHSLSLGGLFFDNIICKYFAKQIKSKFSKDIYEDKKSYLQLLHDCEIIKKRISGTTSDIACVFRNIANISEFKLSINRRTFEKLAREQFSILYVMIRTVLREAAFDSLKLEKIVLTGGSCKIPKIKEMLSNIFANATVDLIHQKHAVALGAVYFASSNLKVEIKNSIQIEGINTKCKTKIIRFENEVKPVEFFTTYITMDLHESLMVDENINSAMCHKDAFMERWESLILDDLPFNLIVNINFQISTDSNGINTLIAIDDTNAKELKGSNKLVRKDSNHRKPAICVKNITRITLNDRQLEKFKKIEEHFKQ